jgi:hypothetical protein
MTSGAPHVSCSQVQQPTAPGMGQHFSSLCKPCDNRKTHQIVEVPGHNHKQSCLLAELQALKAGMLSTEPDLDPSSLHSNVHETFDILVVDLQITHHQKSLDKLKVDTLEFGKGVIDIE